MKHNSDLYLDTVWTRVPGPSARPRAATLSNLGGARGLPGAFGFAPLVWWCACCQVPSTGCLCLLRHFHALHSDEAARLFGLAFASARFGLAFASARFGLAFASFSAFPGSRSKPTSSTNEAKSNGQLLLFRPPSRAHAPRILREVGPWHAASAPYPASLTSRIPSGPHQRDRRRGAPASCATRHRRQQQRRKRAA